MRTPPRRLVMSLLASSVVAATACGGAAVAHVAGPHGADATVPVTSTVTPTSGATASPASSPTADADAGSGRPQFRLDDTDARRTALVNAYSRCLIDHGATRLTGRESSTPMQLPADGNGKPYVRVAAPAPTAAKTACAARLPVMPPEIEASTNPDFHAQASDYVACLRQHGEWVELLNDHNLDWTYVEGHPVPDNNATIEQDCLLASF